MQPVTADAASKKKKKASRPALAVSPINQKNPKYASIVIDAETGTILSSDSADALRHPASLTKMMTLMMVFDALANGKLQPNQRIPISKKAAAMPASKLGLPAGSSIRLDDAMSSLATLSANDMSVALAEAIGGTESEFARKMTAKAKAIGMSRTQYYNASGLPNQYQVTTARDQARLARYILKNYPSQARLFAKQRFDYNGRTYRNHNRLMETYAGMDCCKTGFINASGFNLVASAKRDGRRVIGVVFGGRTTVTRNVHMASLLDKGFDKAKTIDKDIRIAAQRTPAPSTNQRAAESAALAAVTSSTVQPAVPLKEEIVLASASENHEVVQEAYRAAQASTETALQVKKIQPAPNPYAPATQPQTLGTITLRDNNPAPAQLQQASLTALPATTNGWAIQIGAYQTRLATDQAIFSAQRKLPAHLKKTQTMVVPLRTADASWMFRARLGGFTQSEAAEACRYFKDCLLISPQAY
ncbi:MAG: D-alanyl-D-alanine carboxypeptidase [Micavibrio aeruginosavorus]|uniref:D-alanyl-D-alanine carboxypeptidase n=1 Tax=Micavibrio aeruginosavorus TaxID=349221 RepID=A0A2W5FNM0_9BACT|nr:MAG: D-alanyl-D-alanine carboxypeptidase [Micavibrio aeruginosavorus]